MNAKASNAAYRQLTRQIKRLEKQRAKLPPVASGWARTGWGAVRDNPRSSDTTFATVEKDLNGYRWYTEGGEEGSETTLRKAKKAADAALKRAGVLL